MAFGLGFGRNLALLLLLVPVISSQKPFSAFWTEKMVSMEQDLRQRLDPFSIVSMVKEVVREIGDRAEKELAEVRRNCSGAQKQERPEFHVPDKDVIRVGKTVCGPKNLRAKMGLGRMFLHDSKSCLNQVQGSAVIAMNRTSITLGDRHTSGRLVQAQGAVLAVENYNGAAVPFTLTVKENSRLTQGLNSVLSIGFVNNTNNPSPWTFNLWRDVYVMGRARIELSGQGGEVKWHRKFPLWLKDGARVVQRNLPGGITIYSSVNITGTVKFMSDHAITIHGPLIVEEGGSLTLRGGACSVKQRTVVGTGQSVVLGNNDRFQNTACCSRSVFERNSNECP